jgi:HlyD family secretion protein
VVESIDIHEGDLVKPGAIVRIADPEDLELMVYVSAAALGHLRLGQEVPFTTDSHGDETFGGKIAFIASQGEYTPRNLQTQEERVQQMFGVKVELSSAGGKLKAGMSATVHFDFKNGAA